jgi:hypothetical protein
MARGRSNLCYLSTIFYLIKNFEAADGCFIDSKKAVVAFVVAEPRVAIVLNMIFHLGLDSL